MPLLLWSLGIALLTELALVLNWKLLASSGVVPAGIVRFLWIWPSTWVVLLALGTGCLMLAARLSPGASSLTTGRTAAVMLLKLLAPILLVITPGMMMLYSLLMVLAAFGVTSSPEG